MKERKHLALIIGFVLVVAFCTGISLAAVSEVRRQNETRITEQKDLLEKVGYVIFVNSFEVAGMETKQYLVKWLSLNGNYYEHLTYDESEHIRLLEILEKSQ